MLQRAFGAIIGLRVVVHHITPSGIGSRGAYFCLSTGILFATAACPGKTVAVLWYQVAALAAFQYMGGVPVGCLGSQRHTFFSRQTFQAAGRSTVIFASVLGFASSCKGMGLLLPDCTQMGAVASRCGRAGAGSIAQGVNTPLAAVRIRRSTEIRPRRRCCPLPLVHMAAEHGSPPLAAAACSRSGCCCSGSAVGPALWTLPAADPRH